MNKLTLSLLVTSCLGIAVVPGLHFNHLPRAYRYWAVIESPKTLSGSKLDPLFLLPIGTDRKCHVQEMTTCQDACNNSYRNGGVGPSVKSCSVSTIEGAVTIVCECFNASLFTMRGPSRPLAVDPVNAKDRTSPASFRRDGLHQSDSGNAR